MGICGSKDRMKQILLCGLDGVGKTTLLYSEYGMHLDEFTTEPTLGYNFETITIQSQKDNVKVGVFEVGGQETVRYLWPIFYKKVQFDAVLFMIDATDEKRFNEAKSEFHKLANEEELRNVVFCVLYNNKRQLVVEEKQKEEEIIKERETERRTRQELIEKIKKEKEKKDKDQPLEESKDEEEDKEEQVDHEKVKELEGLKKNLDARLDIDELHTFQVRRSFLFNILDPKDKSEKQKMYDWLIGRLRSINE